MEKHVFRFLVMVIMLRQVKASVLTKTQKKLKCFLKPLNLQAKLKVTLTDGAELLFLYNYLQILPPLSL